MREIKYRYCLDKDTNELIYIGDLTKDTRYDHKYKCLECGQEMEANMGPVRRRYFSHVSGHACNGESYLHKLAKRRIRMKFEKTDSFPIVFVRDIPCTESDSCFFMDKFHCSFHNERIEHDLKIWKEKPLYDFCEEEKMYGDFKPDLLLTSKARPALTPIFIEVFKTHKSTEKKINSDYKIIETLKIKSEADIDDIIERGFVENDNCKFFGFTPSSLKRRKADIDITRVIIFPDGLSTFLSHGEVKCGMMNKKYDPKSLLEFNVKSFPHLHEGSSSQILLLPSQVGLAWAVKKGMSIRNCMLCNWYRYNDSLGKYMCIKYKKLGQEFKFPKQNYAMKCNEYVYSFELNRCTLADLQKLGSEVIE